MVSSIMPTDRNNDNNDSVDENSNSKSYDATASQSHSEYEIMYIIMYFYLYCLFYTASVQNFTNSVHTKPLMSSSVMNSRCSNAQDGSNVEKDTVIGVRLSVIMLCLFVYYSW